MNANSYIWHTIVKFKVDLLMHLCMDEHEKLN